MHGLKATSTLTDGSSKSKVAQFDHTPFWDEDVLWLHVTMDYLKQGYYNIHLCRL